jgi:hypothetical protein
MLFRFVTFSFFILDELAANSMDLFFILITLTFIEQTAGHFLANKNKHALSLEFFHISRLSSRQK